MRRPKPATWRSWSGCAATRVRRPHACGWTSGHGPCTALHPRPHRSALQDKIQAFWDITKRELEEARGGARLAARGLEEAQDAHALELKVYRQKVGAGAAVLVKAR